MHPIKRIRNSRHSKVFGALSIIAGIVFLTSSAAMAYILTTATGTSNVVVTAGNGMQNVTVTVTPATGNIALAFDGASGDSYNLSADNSGSASVTISSVGVALTTDSGGGIYNVLTSTFVDTCKASWFTVTPASVTTGWVASGATATVPFSLAGTTTATDSGAFTVSTPVNTTTNQSACLGLEPQITVTVS